MASPYHPYPGPPEPPPVRDTRVIGVVVGLIAAALVVALITIIVLVLRSGVFTQAADEVAETADNAASPSPEEPTEEPQDPPEDEAERDSDPAAEGTSDPDAVVAPTVDGWQGIGNERRPIAYDVPPDWVAESPGLITGYEEEDPEGPFGYSPRVVMSGVARYGQVTCDGDSGAVAQVGTSGMGEVVDTAQGAEFIANEWAEAAYENDDGDLPELTVNGPEAFEANGLEGHLVTMDVIPAEDDCAPDSAHVRVASVHVPSQDDVYNLVLYTDTTVPETPDEDDLDTIFSSLREVTD